MNKVIQDDIIMEPGHFRISEASGGHYVPLVLDDIAYSSHSVGSKHHALTFARGVHNRPTLARKYIAPMMSSASEEELWTYLSQMQFPLYSLSDGSVEQWFDDMVAEWLLEEGTPLNSEVLEEVKRIAQGLHGRLPENTDVSVMDDDGNEIGIEIHGGRGFAFLLICEPNKEALCIVIANGVSRRARYEDSSALPDGFVFEGLRDVTSKDWETAWHFKSSPSLMTSDEWGEGVSKVSIRERGSADINL